MIETVSFDKFLPTIMLTCKGVPEEIAQNYVREKIINFCEMSNILKRTKEIEIPRGMNKVPLEPLEGENIVRVNWVDRDSYCNDLSWRFSRDSHSSFIVDDGFLIFHTPLSTEKVIKVNYTVAPSRDACGVDRIIYDDWLPAIESGVIADIMLIPGYDFSNPQFSQVYQLRYNEHVKRAKIRNVKSESGGAKFVRSRSFI